MVDVVSQELSGKSFLNPVDLRITFIIDIDLAGIYEFTVTAYCTL